MDFKQRVNLKATPELSEHVINTFVGRYRLGEGPLSMVKLIIKL
jgi:hypothetical protein